jgi:hypothetical protein
MDAIAYLVGLLFGGVLAFIGKFLVFLVVWFVFLGLALERLISKSGHAGTLYRWLMGLPFFSAVPAGLSMAGDHIQAFEVFSAINLTISWLVLVYLALAPWPIRKKQ